MWSWKSACFLLSLLQIGVVLAKDTAITIYNSNLALVRETREIELVKGVSDISITDIPGQIIPASVYFNSLTAPNQVTILEQNYEYDLLNSAKLLQRYVDHSLSFETKSGKSFSGILLSADHQSVIIRENSGFKSFRLEDLNEISFPQLPDGLITRPTLHWSLQTDKGGKHNSELGYLTRGVSWNAEYVAVVNDKESQVDLSAWVSIENNCGQTFENAGIKLVAGTVNRAENIPVPREYRAKTLQAFDAAAPFQEKQFFEYHLYTMTRKATISNNENKQISLFEPAMVAVKKTYRYDVQYSGRNAAVFLEFKNDENSGLGMPLPEGVIRAYKRDNDKSLVFLGEDRIEHTPKDELIKSYIGNAFDIIGERNQLNVRHLGSSGREEEWEIKLRNHKNENTEVIVVEHLNPGWEIPAESHAHEKKDATTAEFTVQVPKDGEAVIKYTVRYLR